MIIYKVNNKCVIFEMLDFIREYIVKVFLKYNTGDHKVTGIFVHVMIYKIPDSC